MSLASVTLPSNITTIGRYAYYSCALLSSVDLPEKVSAISIEAFAQCYHLTIIKALSFQYHSFDNNFRGFQDKLIESGFSLDDPKDTTHTLEGALSTVHTGMAQIIIGMYGQE